MKKALKVIIPLVLVLAILGTACWFFLFYRPDLTTGFLMAQASDMIAEKRYDRAILYYDWAWKLEPERSDIPITLAKTYVIADNYTKAEYTLVSAISANPSELDLYLALCRTYVEQDKLLDAVQMLDRTTDADVKATLDSMRPAAPVIEPANGFYDEHIQVSVTAAEEKLYVTSDGQYPANDADLYSGPITLGNGETFIVALCVAENGLVSPAASAGYTVGGVVEEVTLSDPTVEAAARECLGFDYDDVIMTDDLWNITELTLPYTVTDLSDLPLFTGLRSLTIQNTSGLDFTALSELHALEYLDLSGCTFSSDSYEAIGSLTQLRHLALNTCALTDLSPLSQLTSLTYLDLGNNLLEDISILSLMMELETVILTNNPLTTIAGLTTCSKLKVVDISSCQIGSLASLAGKTNLTTLQASNNLLTDLNDLAECKSLTLLVVNSNQITDISAIARLNKLIRFEADRNFITEIPSIAKSSQLQYFSANYNQIESVAGLAMLKSLNTISLDYNKISTLDEIAENPNLIQVNVWDNPVSAETVAKLEEHSIIVNYNPNYEPPEEEPEEDETEQEDS